MLFDVFFKDFWFQKLHFNNTHIYWPFSYHYRAANKHWRSLMSDMNISATAHHAQKGFLHVKYFANKTGIIFLNFANSWILLGKIFTCRHDSCISKTFGTKFSKICKVSNFVSFSLKVFFTFYIKYKAQQVQDMWQNWK